MQRIPLASLQLACGLALAIGPATGPALAQTPRELVARAAAAMGGEPALRDLRSTTMTMNSANFGLGQEETPASPARGTFFSGRVINDFAGRRRSVSQEARPTPSNTMRIRVVVAGDIGLNDQNGTLSAATPGARAANSRLLRLQPERLIVSALDAPAALRAIEPRRLRGELADGVRYTGEDTVAIYFDRQTGLPLATETVTDDPILGDRGTLSMFTRWVSTSGVKFPRQVDTEVNGRLSVHTVVTSVVINEPIPDSVFAIPDSIAGRAVRGPTPPIALRLAELAPGVWRAESGSHHSLVVEQPTGLVVVETPQNSAQTRALLDTLRSRFAAKPVTLTAMSHHHWDHSGGVREALASGLPIAVHRRNGDFVREIAQARKTVAPDALSRRPRAPVIRLVSDSLTVGTGDNRLVLYHFPNSHAEGMLAAYLPGTRLLFVVDVLSPGANLPVAGSQEVVAFVRARGITVDRVVGGHGGIVAWADVERAANP